VFKVRKSLRKWIACIAICVATVGVLMASAHAASASTTATLTTTEGSSSCHSGLCLYQYDDYQSSCLSWLDTGDNDSCDGYGLELPVGTPESNLSNVSTDAGNFGSFDDSVQSVSNNSDGYWCLYSGTNYSGTTFEVHPYEAFSGLPSYINNNIQSVYPAHCPTATGPVIGYQGRCLDVDGGTAYDHVPVDLWTCNGGQNQEWTVSTNTSGNTTVQSLGYCMGTYQGGTASGTKVDMYQCNGSFGQRWVISGGQLVNVGSGTCLDDTNWSTDGAQLQIWPCTGNANQQFSVPN
jgi:hypothetical protein